MTKILTAEQIGVIRADVKKHLQYNKSLTAGSLTPETTLSLLDTLDKWRKTLHDLTPMGSEFVNDPEYCATYIKERIGSTVKLHMQIHELKEQLESWKHAFDQVVDAKDRIVSERDSLKEQLVTTTAELLQLRAQIALTTPELLPEPYVDQTHNVVVDTSESDDLKI